MPTGRYLHWTRAEDIALRLAYAESNSLRRAALVIALARRKGVPRARVHYRAGQLGLAHARHRPWTEDELDDLRYYSGTKSVNWIARKLHRSETAVHCEQYRLRLSGKVRDRGLSVAELEELLGVDERRMRSLRSGCELERNEHGFFDEAEVARWLWDRLDLLDLRKVDQVWLKTILRMKPAAAPAQTKEDRLLHLARKCA